MNPIASAHCKPLQSNAGETRNAKITCPFAPNVEAVETREITVQRTFSGFDEFWAINLKAPSIAPIVAAMESAQIELLQARVRARLPEANGGGVVCQGRAHAIRGRRPK